MSFRKAQKRFRKTNRERSQPGARRGLGLLEKHQDYVKRARDYNQKKEALRVMQEQAALRNPDEFYFHMEKARMRDGELVNVDDEAPVAPDKLKILKSQDQAYLTSERQKEMKRIERMKNELQFLGVERPKQHIVFAGSDEEVDDVDLAEFFDTEPELLGRFHNRPRRSDLEELEFEEPQDVREKKRRRYHELESRIKRKATLDEMLEKVETQKKIMTSKEKSRKVKNAKTGKTVVKWEYRRKR